MMRTLYPAAVALLIVLVGCAPGPAPSPSTKPSSPGTTAGASVVPSSSETTGPATATTPVAGPEPGDGVPDDSGRYAYVCKSLLNVPDVTLSSLAEVWANPGYLRMKSCTARYEGPEPFMPTDAEARIIALAEPGTAAADGVEVYLKALSLCTRVSDDIASEAFGNASKQLLLAASELCPKGPQGKIIALWADGARAGDGTNPVGEGALTPGAYRLRKTPPESCAWTITTPDGRTRANGGAAEGQTGITLDRNEALTTDQCGIWEKTG